MKKWRGQGQIVKSQCHQSMSMLSGHGEKNSTGRFIFHKTVQKLLQKKN